MTISQRTSRRLVENVILPSDEINGRDALGIVFPGIPAIGRPYRGPIDNRERLLELVLKLTPPLVGEVGRGDDQCAFDQSSALEFLQRQPGHDGLSGTGIVSDQEANLGLRQQVE